MCFACRITVEYVAFRRILSVIFTQRKIRLTLSFSYEDNFCVDEGGTDVGLDELAVFPAPATTEIHFSLGEGMFLYKYDIII